MISVFTEYALREWQRSPDTTTRYRPIEYGPDHDHLFMQCRSRSGATSVMSKAPGKTATKLRKKGEVENTFEVSMNRKYVQCRRS